MDKVEQSVQQLENTLRHFGLTGRQVQNLFMEQCTLVNFTKNDLLFKEGKRNGKEYLLLEGVLHRFNENELGENVTTGFYVGMAVITPHFARNVHEKSMFSLQALTDALVAEIPVEALDQLRATHPAFETFGRKVLENELVKNLAADIAYRSNTAKERLVMLRETYPNIENLIPHTVIASYLGITNVSFSRLRSEFSKQR